MEQFFEIVCPKGVKRKKGLLTAPIPCCARRLARPMGHFAPLNVLICLPQASPTKSNESALFEGPRPTAPCKKRRSTIKWCFFFFRAGKGTRTLDPDLGKVVLYQLSYSREVTQL